MANAVAGSVGGSGRAGAWVRESVFRSAGELPKIFSPYAVDVAAMGGTIARKLIFRVVCKPPLRKESVTILAQPAYKRASTARTSCTLKISDNNTGALPPWYNT